MPNTCYECRFCNTVGEDDAWVCDAFLAFIPEPRKGILETCPLEKEKTGKWIRDFSEKAYNKLICSNCKCEPIDKEDDAFYWLTPYCPQCGAKIERVEL